LDYLTPCERLLFENYIPQGGEILDLGVGGGRTTKFLSDRASRYLGVDYSQPMIDACRRKFPKLQFVVADAADLSCLGDRLFDTLVVAFNGLDYVLPVDRRRGCLQEIQRVLKPGGRLIFSSHNPRAVVLRRRWNRERIRQIAQNWSFGSKILRWFAWTMLA